MKLSFSLNKPKPSAAAPAPSLKRPAAFGSAEDDEPIDAAPTSSADSRSHDGVAANKKLLAQNVGASKTLKKRMEAEMRVDATVFEYDEVWDRMQEVKQRQKEAKEHDALERKVCAFTGLLPRALFSQPTVCSQPKYIHGLLATAETRRLDRLRAEEKMMQLERAAEGDEFKDKEVFVTQAYKDQMEEVRKAEEEERRREGKCALSTWSLGHSIHPFRTPKETGDHLHRNDPFLPQTA